MDYFNDLYSEVYEYAYDVITEKKNPPKRGGGKKKLKPKIKTKLKHKKRNLLLLISAMIAAFVVIKKIILKPENQYDQRTSRQKYNSIKSAYKKNDNSIADRTYAYDSVVYLYPDNNIKNEKDITISYCNKMIKELTKDKKVIDDFNVEDYKDLRNALIIEKRLKNPLTRLLDSKYLSSSMRKRIQMLYDKNKTNIDNVNNWDDIYEEIEDEEIEEIEEDDE